MALQSRLPGAGPPRGSALGWDLLSRRQVVRRAPWPGWRGSSWRAQAWQLHTTFPALGRCPALMTVGLHLS